MDYVERKYSIRPCCLASSSFSPFPLQCARAMIVEGVTSIDYFNIILQRQAIQMYLTGDEMN
jgi:hypothetical protein